MLEELLAKWSEVSANILIYFPKAIVEWFDLTAADVLRLQYIALILPIFSAILSKILSKVIAISDLKMKAFNALMTLMKFIFMMPVILFFDEVIRQYWPLSLIKEWPGPDDIEPIVSIISAYVSIIEIGLLLALFNWLTNVFAWIHKLIFKESKIITIKGNADNLPALALADITNTLLMLLNDIALGLYAFVLYYNHCM